MSSISITGSDSGATAGLTDAELRATPVPVEGSHTPADSAATPTDAVNVEAYMMVWNPIEGKWSRWGAYSIDDDTTDPGVPGVAMFGRPGLGLGETPHPAGVVNTLDDEAEAVHGLRVVSSDLYRDGTDPILGRQSDGQSDANSKKVVGLVAPVVYNGATFDRVRAGAAIGSIKVDASGAAVPVTDNGGSLTVDGSVTVSGTVTASGPLTDAQLRATAVPVSGTVTASGPLTDTQLRATPVPVSGTVTASGPLTDTQLRNSAVPVSGPVTDTQLRASAVPVSGSGAFHVDDNSGSLTVDAPVATPVFVRLSDGAAAISALPVTDNGGSLTVDGTVTANAGSGTFTTKETRSATPGQTTVSSSAVNVTVLASNASRLGATIYNDSTQILYLKLGATASTSSFSVAMAAAAYYEVPFAYTGIIDGIWASANGNARVTELT